MSEYFGIFCLAAPLLKAVLGLFGYHAADPIIDQLSNLCVAGAGSVGGVILAKSDKFVK